MPSDASFLMIDGGGNFKALALLRGKTLTAATRNLGTGGTDEDMLMIVIIGDVYWWSWWKIFDDDDYDDDSED